jgi:hypothetical protein
VECNEQNRVVAKLDEDFAATIKNDSLFNDSASDRSRGALFLFSICRRHRTWALH